MDQRRSRGSWRRIVDKEQGAITVFAGITLSLVITATALAVDIGHQVYTERRLDSVVDMAVHDAGQAIGNRRDPTRSAYDVALQFAQESALRNDFTYDAVAAGNSLILELGMADETTKVFTPFPPGTPAAVLETANALRITATTKTNFAFMPGSAPANSSAIVLLKTKCTTNCNPNVCPTGTAACEYKIANAAVSLGSRLASFNSRDSVLNAVLGGLVGGNVSLSAASYDGLAATDVSLGAIWTELGLDAGSSSEVLETQVTLADLIQAQIDVLTAQGDAASLEAAMSLQALKTATGGNLRYTFDQILDLGLATPGSAADATVNVLSLLSVAAEASNGTNAVTFGLPVSIPGVASGTVSMVVVETPVIAVGPAEQDSLGNWVTHARTGQARMFLNLTLANGITIGTTSAPIRLPLYIEGGTAQADLTSISCQTINTDSTTTVDTETTALTAYIGDVTQGSMSNPSTPPTPAPAQLVNVASLVTVTGYGMHSVAGVEELITFAGLYDDRVEHIGATTLSLDSLSSSSDITVSPLGLTTATVEGQVRAAIDPVLAQIESALLAPLSTTPLGLTFGGAEVANPSADCLYETLITE